jgi:glycine betaine/proline transport system substrate-binding protein
MKTYLAIGTALSLLTATGVSAAEPESCRTVRYADPGWTDIASTNALLKAVIEPLGYKADIATLSVPIVFRSLAANKLDIFLGNWMPTQTATADPLVKDGSIEVIKVNLSGNRFTLAVPSYVAKAGIKSFADLAGHSDKFDRKIYGIEAGSSLNQNLTKMIEKNAYGLGEWKLIESSEQGMLAQVERAVKREAWVVFPAWEPHPMNEQYDLVYLPGGDEHFGPNLGAAEVRTITRAGFSKDCPNLTRLLKNMAFSVELENAMMKRILVDGISADKAAAEALQKNPDVLDTWLKDVTTFGGEPGLVAVKTASSAVK